MTLFDNPAFYLGALLSSSALVAIVAYALFSFSSARYHAQRLPSPVLFFLGPYVGFLCLSFIRPYFPVQYVPGINPGVYNSWAADLLVVGLYLLGGLAFLAGYIAFPAAARRYGHLWGAIVSPFATKVKSVVATRRVPFFITSVLVIWLIGLLANILVFIEVRGIPLFDIARRSGADPKLVFLTEFQPVLILNAPYAFHLRNTVPARFRSVSRPLPYLGLLGVSLVALTLLGTRNLPAKLGLGFVVFLFLTTGLHGRSARRNIAFVSLLALLLLVVSGIAGAFTKVEIYHFSFEQLPGAIVGTPLADSIGNLYSFQAMVSYSGLYGHFYGQLLSSTFLSYVPGRDELYANYIVGQILGYRPDQLRSISSTFNGPAYLDFGVLGLIGNSTFFGFALGYGWKGFKESPRNVGAVALLIVTITLDITLGTYNLWSFFSIGVLLACVEFNRIP